MNIRQARHIQEGQQALLRLLRDGWTIKGWKPKPWKPFMKWYLDRPDKRPYERGLEIPKPVIEDLLERGVLTESGQSETGVSLYYEFHDPDTRVIE